MSKYLSRQEGEGFMVNDDMIKRINELSKKMKDTGLTEEEKLEQQELRKKYVAAFKTSLRAQLDSIEFVDEPKDGQSGKGRKH
jgi:uncharacterized protein YnzC (UPF0291/DUF896 family)